MKRTMKNRFARLLAMAAVIGVLTTDIAQAQKRVITSDDNPSANSAAFYTAGGTMAAPKLTLLTTVSTGGTGIGNGFFSTNTVAVSHDPTNQCAYVSDGGSGDIVGISIPTQKVTGTFRGAAGDTGSFFGIGLALNNKFLYASFTDVNRIGEFSVGPGCILTFVGDVHAVGLNGFPVGGMAVNAKMLVVAYVDGSIQSFNVSRG